jgi:hypothetical protein
MKSRTLFCVVALIMLVGSVSFAQTQGSSLLESLRSLLDSGSVKVVFAYVTSSTYLTAEMQSINTSKFPILTTVDSRTSQNATFDLTRIIAFNFEIKTGHLSIYW